MRLVLPVALVLLTLASVALGQSQVDDTASSSPENASDQAPLPGPEYRVVPSQPDPKATREVAGGPAPTEQKLRPGAPYVDHLSGHWLIGASGGYATLLGNFSSDTPIGSRLGGAYLLGLDAGYGLTSHWELGLAGEFVESFAGTSCSNCSSVTYGIGPRLRYHLVGGTRFSPWVAYGWSLRRTEFDHENATTFDAIEPVRMELGGNWYLTSTVALGPVLAASFARTIEANDQGTGRWQTLLSAGLRLSLDPTGR